MKKIPRGERRTVDQLRTAYEIEKELADRLRSADREDRKTMYHAVYDEWNRRVFHNEQLRSRQDRQEVGKIVREQAGMLGRYLRPEITVLEIGPGDCSLAAAVAPRVRKLYAVDVADASDHCHTLPPNCTLLATDGCSIPVPEGSIDLAYSNQVMEHLHPDDAAEQVRNICSALAPGGVYICVTPNRLCGPHDISGYFVDVASGFHIREYASGELADIFRIAGFSRCRLLIGAKGFYLQSPVGIIRLVERLLEMLPSGIRRRAASLLPVRVLLGVKLVAVK